MDFERAGHGESVARVPPQSGGFPCTHELRLLLVGSAAGNQHAYARKASRDPRALGIEGHIDYAGKAPDDLTRLVVALEACVPT